MTQHSIAGAHLASSHPHSHPHAHPRPAKPVRRRSSRRLGSLILWEWGVVLALLTGLAVTLLAMSHGSDPRREADRVVGQMKAVLAGKAPSDPLFGVYPIVSGGGREAKVTIRMVPPKVCVLASWDLYRLGAVSVNGVTPLRVSAAKLVELCNEGEAATIVWSPKSSG